MSQHFALILPEKCGNLEVGLRPTPKPGPGEVLIKVNSTALNPADAKIWKFGAWPLVYPSVLGFDSSGVVEEVGEGVTTLVKGDRVLHEGEMTATGTMMTYQQYSLVPAEIAAKIPSWMSFDQAATIPAGLATAAVGLYLPLGEGFRNQRNPDGNAGLGLIPPWTKEGEGKYKGNSIVVLGGSSSVGQFAIQLAKLSGFEPIITTSSLAHETFLKEIGASHVVDRNGDAIATIKNLLTGGETDVVYDAISTKETQQIAVAVSSEKAAILLTLARNKDVDYGGRFATWTYGSVYTQRKLGVSLYRELPTLLESGTIKPNRHEVLQGGLNGIPAGLERLANYQVSGTKLVAHPWD